MRDEADAIQGCLRDRAEKEQLAVDVEILDDKQATIESVLDAMDRHSWVHFACHGIQHPDDPVKSAFALHDGNLELSRLMRKPLKNAQLAVLSACQTAMGDVTLPQETVNLAAGMLAAGYRGVIGTMWSIRDADAPILAKALYSNLLQNSARGKVEAAYALHDAVASLRQEIGEEEFHRWVPFVHYGQ